MEPPIAGCHWGSGSCRRLGV